MQLQLRIKELGGCMRRLRNWIKITISIFPIQEPRDVDAHFSKSLIHTQYFIEGRERRTRRGARSWRRWGWAASTGSSSPGRRGTPRRCPARRRRITSSGSNGGVGFKLRTLHVASQAKGFIINSSFPIPYLRAFLTSLCMRRGRYHNLPPVYQSHQYICQVLRQLVPKVLLRFYFYVALTVMRRLQARLRLST